MIAKGHLDRYGHIFTLYKVFKRFNQIDYCVEKSVLKRPKCPTPPPPLFLRVNTDGGTRHDLPR